MDDQARRYVDAVDAQALDRPAEQVQIEKGGVTNFGKLKYGIRQSVPIAPYLNAASLSREKEESLRRRKGVELNRVASLDPVTVANIHKKHGVNAYNLKGDDGKKLLAIIEREYPHLKTTNKKVSRQGDKHAPKMVFGRQQYASIPKECL